MRALVVLLVGPLLPSETKREIADLLIRSCEVDMRTPSEQSLAFLRDIAQGSHLHFDDWLPELLVGINPHAPGRGAAAAIQEIIRKYKTEHQISDTRRREEKIDVYLAIWDLREGWTGEGYDVNRELRLKEIAQRLKISISTVQNRYRSAFRYIVGHDYSAEMWLQVMGLPKLRGFFGSDLPRASIKRPRVNRLRRDVPVSVLEKAVDPAEGRLVGILESHRPTFGNLEDFEFMSDVRFLIDRGRTNEEIVAELELQSPRASDLVEYLRGRRDDRL